MPAEPTKTKLKRRSCRKDLDDYRFDTNHARELEQKRARGEVSCAECRRLKIKCDKQIPCQSCQRRGCSALCPNGSLATGQGTRFVLAATEHLHHRISRLSGRIRQLEDALASLQAQHSSDPHPLLREDLIMDEDREDDRFGTWEDPTLPGVGGGGMFGIGASQGSSSEVFDAFGTLSISDNGIARFFGPTGGSESLLLANLDISPSSPETTDSPPSSPRSSPPTNYGETTLFSRSFPFTPVGVGSDIQELIESHLPPWGRAQALCETYLDQITWFLHTVTRGQLMDDLLPAIYRKHSLSSNSSASPEPAVPAVVGSTDEDNTGPHYLALLFIVFAIASLVQPESPEALGEHYHQLSKAAIGLQPVLERPSVVTIQTLHLTSVYNAMSGSDSRSETTMEVTWSLTTLAAHLSQTIGLHRDSTKWGLSAKAVQRRRIVFWDLFIADVWQSLNTGRPPSLSLPYIDCGYPDLEDADPFHIWQCRFAAECVAEVTSRTLTAEAPSYATIMELDKKVREFPLPDVSQAKDSMGSSFASFVLMHIRETVLMYIHRSFFAQAIIEHPENPLKSVYAPSFLASYRASSTILKAVREQFNTWPISCSKFWIVWTFAFSAAVVFGTVVTRGPRSPLAQSAMAELEQACLLFAKASVYNIRTTKALPILTKLSEKARYALAAAVKDSEPSSGDQTGLLWNIKQEDSDDELSILAGHTRFVFSKKTQASSQLPGFRLYPSAFKNQSHLPQPHQRQRSSESQSQVMDYDLSVQPPPVQPPPPPPMINSWPTSDQPDSSTFLSIEPMEDHLRFPYVSSDRTRPSLHSRDNVSWRDQQSLLQPYRHHSTQPPTTAGPGSMGFSSPTSPSPNQHAFSSSHGQHRYASVNPYPPSTSSQKQTRPIARHRSSRHLIHEEESQYPSRYPQEFPPSHHHLSSQMTHPQHQNYGLSGLADLGLASRDSRLDERWGTFMEDSGLLEGIDFRG